jgi:hypothetical protein
LQSAAVIEWKSVPKQRRKKEMPKKGHKKEKKGRSKGRKIWLNRLI